MATTKAAGTTTRRTTEKPTARRSASRRPTARAGSASPRSSARAAATRPTASTTPTQPVARAQVLAERAVLVPVGAALLARDNLASTVRGLASRYGTREPTERELRRYEQRGASARTDLKRQVRRSRERFERLVSEAQERIGTLP